MLGRVIEVTEVNFGSELAAALVGGETSLTVVDPTDFEEEGGSLIIGSEVIAYSTVDDVTGEVALLAAVVGAYDEEEPVYLQPYVTERIAHVSMADDDDASEPVEARVPHSLFDKLPLGPREITVDAEAVTVEFSGDELVVTDVQGATPIVDGSFIDTDTLDIPTPDLTDGFPPSDSPDVTLVPGIGSIYVLFDAVINDDPVTYELHMDTSSGFTPDATTLVAEGADTYYSLRTDPDGVALDYNTTYYVVAFAKDADGGGYADPTPSHGVEASASPKQATSGDIAAQNVIAEHLLANDAMFGTLRTLLVVSNTFATALSGQRTAMDSQGIRLISSAELTLVNLPTDAGQAASFKGQIEASGGLLVQTAKATFDYPLGEGVYVSPGTIATIGGGAATNPSVAPSLTVTWELQSQGDASALSASLGTVNLARGLHWNNATDGYGSQATFFMTRQGTGGVSDWYIIETKAADGTYLRGALIPVADGETAASGDTHSVAAVGNYLYVLSYYSASGRRKLRKVARSDLTTYTSPYNVTIANVAGDIATDGSELWMTYYVTDTSIAIYRYSTGGVLVASYTCDLGGTGRIPYGLAYDGANFWLRWYDGGTTYVDKLGTPSGGAMNASSSSENRFKLPAKAVGIAHDGTRFWTTYTVSGATPQIVKHSTFTWTSSSGDLFHVGYAWFITADSTHSALSPTSYVNAQYCKRSRIKITRSSAPSGVTAVRYFAKQSTSSSAPSTSSMLYQSATTYVTTEGSSNTDISYLVGYNSSGSPTGYTSNTLSVAVSYAELRAQQSLGFATKTWRLDGDGSMFLPTLTSTNRDTNPTTFAYDGGVFYNDTRLELQTRRGAATDADGVWLHHPNIPPGVIMMMAAPGSLIYTDSEGIAYIPGGWLECDGTTKSRSTYADLYAAIVASLGTVTMTIASPGVVTWVGTGGGAGPSLKEGDAIVFSTTGALPTGITAGTVYYVQQVVSSTTFKVAATRNGAAINTTGTQSGVHTLRACPFEGMDGAAGHSVGDGSSTFTLPDFRGRVPVGPKNDGTPSGEMENLGQQGGEETHTLTTAELATHTHTFTGSALAGHTHTFTGSALGTHTHTFTGNAVAAHSHSHSHAMASGGNIVKILSGGFTVSTTNGNAASNATTDTDATTGGAHTPGGTNSSDSAGTPAGTLDSVSGGTPAGTNANAGSGSAHNNIQPYQTVRFIIKT